VTAHVYLAPVPFAAQATSLEWRLAVRLMNRHLFFSGEPLKSNKIIVRLTLIAAVTAVVCLPCLKQLRITRADAPPPTAPTFPAAAPEKVVLAVGDQKMTAGEVNTIFEHLDQQTQKQIMSQPNWKRDLAEHFIKLKLMAAEAKRLKLDESPNVKLQYEQILERVLLNELAADKSGANLKYFEENKQWFSGLKARHILVGVTGPRFQNIERTEAQAKAKAEDIRSRLVKKPEDFVAIARTESDDRSSAATGGDLGIMTRYQMVPAFEEAAYALKDNEFSQPVKTPFGYHIIQVLGRTPATYEECAELVKRRRVEALVEELKKKTKTVVDESFFGPEIH
jgi:parvulin-like peptidyl-prolyl isomerase